MLKAERDQLMTSLTTEERQEFRNVIQKIRQERQAAAGKRTSVREVLDAQGNSIPVRVLQALEGVAVRDEMGPKVGETPPDFDLKRMGSQERVRLSSFRAGLPVALAFGSYT